MRVNVRLPHHAHGIDILVWRDVERVVIVRCRTVGQVICLHRERVRGLGNAKASCLSVKERPPSGIAGHQHQSTRDELELTLHQRTVALCDGLHATGTGAARHETEHLGIFVSDTCRLVVRHLGEVVVYIVDVLPQTAHNRHLRAARPSLDIVGLLDKTFHRAENALHHRLKFLSSLPHLLAEIKQNAVHTLILRGSVVTIYIRVHTVDIVGFSGTSVIVNRQQCIDVIRV